MFDKNGLKIHAGDIVRIEGGYLKNDNGLFFVEQDGTNPGYLADDSQVTLHRICRNGKISTAKYTLAFFPLACYCNDYMKRAAARAWNKEHAVIEVVNGVNTEHIAEWFRGKAEELREQERYYKMRGFNDKYVGTYTATAKWHEDVVARMTA